MKQLRGGGRYLSYAYRRREEKEEKTSSRWNVIKSCMGS
jgi:hypothetical protein